MSKMTKADASRIQSGAAATTGEKTDSDSFAVRAQRAADKNVNASKGGNGKK